MSTFAEQVAAALLEEASAIGARWEMPAGAASPQATQRSVVGRATTAAHRAALAAAVEYVPTMVHAVACAVRQAPRCQDGVLRAGWQYGTAAHLAGAALHDVVKDLDLLAAIALYVAERTAVKGAAQADVGAAEGVRVTRRLHRAFAALRLAASKGYTHAAGEELRAHYRTLRHDLRNPLGTIRSAVALMEDESLPADVRFSARYRAMVARNTASLDDLIGVSLGDAATEYSTLALQEVSLRDLALAVRRDMREEAEVASCTIDVAPSLAPPEFPALVADAATLELALRSVLSVTLARARPGSTIGIALRATSGREDAVVVAVSSEMADAVEARPARDDSLSFAESLMRRVGGRVWRENGGTMLLEVPVVAVATPGAASVSQADRDVAVDDADVDDAAVGGAVEGLLERRIGVAAQPPAGELPAGGGPPS